LLRRLAGLPRDGGNNAASVQEHDKDSTANPLKNGARVGRFLSAENYD